MTIYYIAVSSWDGHAYTFDYTVSSWDGHAHTFDYIRPFISKEKRDEALKKMKEAPSFKQGNISLYADEEEVEDMSTLA